MEPLRLWNVHPVADANPAPALNAYDAALFPFHPQRRQCFVYFPPSVLGVGVQCDPVLLQRVDNVTGKGERTIIERVNIE